jgi:thiol-disulfide isomerase/thioredoxin
LQLAGAALLPTALTAAASGRAAAASASAQTRVAGADSAGDGARWRPWPVGTSTPRLDLPDAEGTPWSLAQHAGRPVLLNFWASWCEPCRAELPSLGLLARQFQAQGLLVVAVNFKESADSVRRVRDAQGLPLVWLRDSYGEAARAWGVRSFPASVLVGRRGRALLAIQGVVDWADAPVQQRLAALW